MKRITYTCLLSHLCMSGPSLLIVNHLFLEFICRWFVESVCSMFIREIDLKFSFVTFLCGFGIRLVASEKSVVMVLPFLSYGVFGAVLVSVLGRSDDKIHQWIHLDLKLLLHNCSSSCYFCKSYVSINPSFLGLER